MNTHSNPLGRQVPYSFTYDPGQLCPIARRLGREAAQLTAESTGWHGEDIWNIYELSWLSPSGLPAVAMAELRIPADSPNLIESKSLKLYCNSFNMSRFENSEAVRSTMQRDLGEAAGSEVTILFTEPADFLKIGYSEPDGVCLDHLSLSRISFTPDPSLLATGKENCQETLFSRLFRSCCPVTGQPDWATVTVSYTGKRLVPESLLSYLISFREHSGFHEACVEKIFSDIMEHASPDQLTVAARFTRRGGIDINPVRSTMQGRWPNHRDPRQ